MIAVRGCRSRSWRFTEEEIRKVEFLNGNVGAKVAGSHSLTKFGSDIRPKRDFSAHIEYSMGASKKYIERIFDFIDPPINTYTPPTSWVTQQVSELAPDMPSAGSRACSVVQLEGKANLR
jgi:hypothetical protein